MQAFGKLDCSPLELGADCVSISSHKIHGPMGVGALVLAGELELAPLVHGGGQEQGLRAGTENVAGIAGFGRAAELAEELREETCERLGALRAEFLAALSELPGLRVLEPGARTAPPLCSIAAVLVPGVPAEVLMHHLEARGVYVSAGSACNAGHKTASPGLLALGLAPEETARVLRFSFARTTAREEALRGARALLEVAARAQRGARMSPETIADAPAVVLVRYGELALKGGNRGEFEKTLVRNIQGALEPISEVEIDPRARAHQRAAAPAPGRRRAPAAGGLRHRLGLPGLGGRGRRRRRSCAPRGRSTPRPARPSPPSGR